MPEQQVPQISSGTATIISIIYLAFVVLMIASMWKIFTKAGEPGWAALIPFYNAYIMLKIAGKPGWWLIMLCIPLVGLIYAILALVSFCEKFGKGAGYVLGLIFLGPIFLPMLAFGDAQYQGSPGSLGQPALS